MNLIVFYLKFKFPALLDEFIIQATSFLESILNVFKPVSFPKSKCLRGIRTTPESMKCVFIPGTKYCFSFAAILISPSVSCGFPSPMRPVGPHNSTHALTSTFHSPAVDNLLTEKLGQVQVPTLLTRCTGNKNKKNRARKDRPTHPCSKGVRENRNSRKAAKQFTQVSWAAYSYPGESEHCPTVERNSRKY